MAKVSFTKLGLVKTMEPQIIEFNGQQIEVKQYLPANEKLELISNVINQAADENNFSNPVKLDIFTTLEILYNYTNINFTDKQKEDPVKLYDLVASNGLFSTIAAAIPQYEYNYLISSVRECSDAVYTYRNSAMGVLNTISTDYSNLELDATELQGKLADPDNLAFLKEIVTKLG